MPELSRDVADPPDDAFDRLGRTTRELQQHLADLIGEELRCRYQHSALLFSDLLQNPTVMPRQQLNNLMRQTVADGRLSRTEASRLLWTDIVIRGGNPDASTYLVVEVSRTVSERDVRVAARRASTLRKAGYEARAAVAGQNIRQSALELAEPMGVGRMFECALDGEDPVIDDSAM